MSAHHDPAVERAAMALAACERVPPASREEWWAAIGEWKRGIYRYRASVAIEAYEQTEVADAAE